MYDVVQNAAKGLYLEPYVLECQKTQNDDIRSQIAVVKFTCAPLVMWQVLRQTV